MRSVANRIRLARRAAGLTQADVAEQLQVGRSAVAQWERADGSNPAATNLAKLAIVLECAFEWLATGRGSRLTRNDASNQSEETAVVMRHFARDDAEDHLLAVFRELDERDQNVITTLADALADRPIGQRKKSKAE
jgi:transcriptional regulator with XRE-family HTH domain